MNRDVGGIEPEQRGGHLGEGRLRALPERRHAGGDGGAPGPVHAHGHALVGAEARARAAEERGGRIAGELHVARHADADVAPLLPPLLLPRAERLVAHARERQLEGARVVAAVVRRAADVLERQLVGSQEVAAPEVGGILTQATRQPVDEDLADVVRLGLPVAAVGAHGHLVGQHDAAVDLGVVEPIGPGEHDAGQQRRPERPVVGAEVDQVAVAQREQRAVAVGPQRQRVHGLARVGGAAEEFRAVLDPLHRAPRVDGERGRR